MALHASCNLVKVEQIVGGNSVRFSLHVMPELMQSSFSYCFTFNKLLASYGVIKTTRHPSQAEDLPQCRVVHVNVAFKLWIGLFFKQTTRLVCSARRSVYIANTESFLSAEKSSAPFS